MISVPLPWEELKPLLENNNMVYPAVFNGPTTVVAGTAAAVTAFEKQMKQKRLLCVPINISHAIHSPLMEPIRHEFENRLKKIKLNSPKIPYISNVSGKWITAVEAVQPAYWGKHLCTTVRFSDGLKVLLNRENNVFIEIGPGRLLSNIVRHHIPAGKENKYKIVNTIKHQQEKITDDYYLLSKIGEMWIYGISIDWNGYYQDREEIPTRIPLPVYPFEKKPYWLDEHPFAKLGEWLTRPGENRPLEEPEPEPSTGTEPGEYEDREYEAPRDELEQAVARLWQEFLGFELIGIQENFFDINGDSLTATLLVTRLQQLYPVEISLQQFFENPTIASQAQLIKELLAAKIKELSEEELAELAESMEKGG
jgi:acyl transferase domain-containing protein